MKTEITVTGAKALAHPTVANGIKDAVSAVADPVVDGGCAVLGTLLASPFAPAIVGGLAIGGLAWLFLHDE